MTPIVQYDKWCGHMQIDGRFKQYLEKIQSEVSSILLDLGTEHDVEIAVRPDGEHLKFLLLVDFDDQTNRPSVRYSYKFNQLIEKQLNPALTAREQELIIEGLKIYRLVHEMKERSLDGLQWYVFGTELERAYGQFRSLVQIDRKSIEELNEKIIRAAICSHKVEFSQEALAESMVSPYDFEDLQKMLFGKVILDPRANVMITAKTFKNTISRYWVRITSDDGPGR